MRVYNKFFIFGYVSTVDIMYDYGSLCIVYDILRSLLSDTLCIIARSFWVSCFLRCRSPGLRTAHTMHILAYIVAKNKRLLYNFLLSFPLIENYYWIGLILDVL